MNHMMSLTKYGVCLILLVLACSGCEKKLEPITYTNLTPDNFPKNETDLNTAVTGVYNRFRAMDAARNWTAPYVYQQGGMMLNNETTTDEFATSWGWEDELNFTFKPTDAFPAQFWSRAQPAITMATLTIEMVKAADYISDEKKQALISELRCIRSLFAFDLYDQYGPVPIITDSAIVMDLQKAQQYKPARPSQQEYVSYLEQELAGAAAGLPVTIEKSNFGRMTRGIALTCLLKLYMHDKAWAKAVAISKQIMDLNYYGLQASYKDIWSLDNEGNNEIIWAIPMTNQGDNVNAYLFGVLPGDFVSLKQGDPKLSISPWGRGFILPWPVWDSFDPLDKRREVFPRYYWNGSAMVDLKSSPGAIPLKYPVTPEMSGAGNGSDFVNYRYADVLLYRAEALNELNGVNGESVDIINMLRARAGLSALSAGSFNQLTLRSQLLKERQWELCFEGVRRQDLIRNGSFVSNALARGRQFAQPYHVLYPIPQYAIDENSNIDQNPGY